MCTDVARLSAHAQYLKVAFSDGCGQVLSQPDAKKAMKQAIEDGTDTVSTTYALYQLTVSTPKLAAQDRKKAIDELKVAVKTKRVVLGKSLEDERVRLLS